MRFDIITIFPDIFDAYFSKGVIARGQKNKLIKIVSHDLRSWTTDRHKSVDDKPYGGGSGMVLMAEPILKAVKKVSSLNRGKKKRIILFSAKGKSFDQKTAKRLAKFDQIILISGRYEGVDERVAKYIADEEISIGPYILTGGELPAMVVVDAVSRLIPGVISSDSLKEESFDKEIGGEYPQYTRPENIKIEGKERKVPKVLLSGNHGKIEEWRKSRCKIGIPASRRN